MSQEQQLRGYSPHRAAGFVLDQSEDTDNPLYYHYTEGKLNMFKV